MKDGFLTLVFGVVVQELVSEFEETTNVVGATNRPKLFDRLEHLQSQLVLCEKALAEYLETKRLAFPRFYFVSSADLLDILSNGNQPEKVRANISIMNTSRITWKIHESKNPSGNLA